MKRRFVFAIPFMVLAFVLLGGLAVMLLWNAILPAVLGVSVLNIWQAIGILALSRLLFGGFGGGPWRGRRGGPPHWKNQWVNTESIQPGDLSIISERIDPAPGTHKIKYHSPIDDIEIIHTAHNRKGFATGAVIAAEFIKGKKGIFSMKDVLGF